MNELPKMTPYCVRDVLEGVTAPAAYWLLHLLGCPHEVVYTASSPYCVDVKSLVKRDEISCLAAEQVQVKFWGGPPTRLNWYRGTLQDLVVDRILDFYTTNSLEALVAKLCLNVC